MARAPAFEAAEGSGACTGAAADHAENRRQARGGAQSASPHADPPLLSVAAGLLDGPVVLAAALLAAGGPAAEPGQAVIRTNVGNLVLTLLQEASEVWGCRIRLW